MARTMVRKRVSKKSHKTQRKSRGRGRTINNTHFWTNLCTPAPTRTLLYFILNPRSDRKFNISPVANDARRYFECLREILPDCISSIDQRDQIETALKNCRCHAKDNYVFPLTSYVCPSQQLLVYPKSDLETRSKLVLLDHRSDFHY